jgi:hypothetical protein
MLELCATSRLHRTGPGFLLQVAIRFCSTGTRHLAGRARARSPRHNCTAGRGCTTGKLTPIAFPVRLRSLFCLLPTLFCSPPTSNLFPFISFRTLSQKTPGVGYPLYSPKRIQQVPGESGLWTPALPEGSFAGMKVGILPSGYTTKHFRIISLCDHSRELSWNHILAKNLGGGGHLPTRRHLRRAVLR